MPRYNYAAQLDGELRGLMRDIRGMLLDGRYVLTREVEDFEQAFAAYLGVPHARGVGSGTDALVIALQALGIGPRDEVVTHANTFHATVAAIVLVGATPVLVDAVEETFLMDVEQASAAVTTRTRVLVPVHLCGKPTPMEPVLALAERHGLRVMEDAAQAHGARWNGRRVGTFGIAGCFSFHPSKNLAAAGDGGAIVTHDAGLDAEIACRRALGQRQQNDHVRVGMNSKLDALQARILSAKLARLDRWSDERRRAARWYHQRLAGLPVRPQAWDADEEHVFHLFQVSTDRRDALLEHLRGNGVDAVVRYPVPIHLQPAFADQGWRAGQFPVAERLSRETLCLPIRPDLAEDEVDYVAECIRGFFGGAGA
ncbi:MAG TPA: DegT/DnrJ/EryC1/StrS family aminotransferase [Longimicrobium sp.]|nr:DegT/DnrJ/EryC1/StrS family aminotransferase [Longimicrobium sp.]